MAFYSATLLGVRPVPVEIEVDLSSGLPFFQIVGLPDAILRESKTRVKSAIVQGGFEFPYDQRLVLNLAPSRIPKEGSGFELGLAARILASSAQIPAPPGHTLFLGELALDGTVRSVPQLGALAYATRDLGRLDRLVVAADAVRDLPPLPYAVVAVDHLRDLGAAAWWQKTVKRLPVKSGGELPVESHRFGDLQFSPFWARHLEIAAVGGHHYFLCGPPGCGKTFFAESLRSLRNAIPHETPDELKVLNAVFRRSPHEFPWAAPHHSVTAAGLLGGGVTPRPGAVTRAHGGILFLDELLEFSGGVLDALREPMERRRVEVHRAGVTVEFPSGFQLITCTNPCRCGYWRHPLRACTCQEHGRKIYQGRMSGPFFDRLDVRVLCLPVLDYQPFVGGEKIRRRVEAATEFKRRNPALKWAAEAEHSLREESRLARVSLRAENKIRAVAVTLAALDLHAQVEMAHLREAISLQSLAGLGED